MSKTWDKSRLPSRHVTEGPARAPHRSYYYAMGLSTKDIKKPFVGVASCWNEAAPCNTALMRQAQDGCVLAYKFKGQRFDCGSAEGYIAATNFCYENFYLTGKAF